MDVATYQELSQRTAPKDYAVPTRQQMDLMHAAMGLSTEVGELVDSIKKHVIYGKVLDLANIQEEAGDTMWYFALLFETLGIDLDAVFEQNINKLRKRYPDGFSEAAAVARVDQRMFRYELKHRPTNTVVGFYSSAEEVSAAVLSVMATLKPAEIVQYSKDYTILKVPTNPDWYAEGDDIGLPKAQPAPGRETGRDMCDHCGDAFKQGEDCALLYDAANPDETLYFHSTCYWTYIHPSRLQEYLDRGEIILRAAGPNGLVQAG